MRTLGVLVAFALLAAAKTVIIQIDDTFGDALTGVVPQYTTVSDWSARNGGSSACEDCIVHPDSTQMLFGTWHEEETVPQEIPANITFSFSGTSVRVFCTLVGDLLGYSGTRLNTLLTFYIDNDPNSAVEFQYNPPAGSTEYLYKQVVYQNSVLSPGAHVMEIVTWSNGIHESIILFDYAEYEIEVEETSTISSSFTTISASSISTSFSSLRSDPPQSMPQELTVVLTSVQSVTITNTFYSTAIIYTEAEPTGISSTNTADGDVRAAGPITESTRSDLPATTQTSTTHPSNAAGVAAGVTLGIVVTIACIVWLVVARRRRKRRVISEGVDSESSRLVDDANHWQGASWVANPSSGIDLVPSTDTTKARIPTSHVTQT